MILRRVIRVASTMAKGTSVPHLIFIFLIVISLAVLSILFLTLKNTKSPAAPVFITSKPTIKETQIPKNTVGIFLVALGDAGKTGKEVGCGDSLIKVMKETADTNSLQTAVNELLSIKSSTYGEKGLYNALSLSSLTLQSVQRIGNTDVVNLTGKYFLGGICDGPRLIEQVRATAGEYSEGRPVKVMINGTPAEQLFSGKGEDVPITK